MFVLNLTKNPVSGGSYTFSTADQGQIVVTDIGDKKIKRVQTWGILINHGMKAYEYGYEGGGELNISVEKDGELSIKGNGELYDLKYI